MRHFAILVLALAACSTEPNRCASTNPSDPATEVFAPSLNIDLSTWAKTPSGVYTQDVVVGTGATLQQPTTVSNC